MTRDPAMVIGADMVDEEVGRPMTVLQASLLAIAHPRSSSK
jgi:hypothetical protein